MRIIFWLSHHVTGGRRFVVVPVWVPSGAAHPAMYGVSTAALRCVRPRAHGDMRLRMRSCMHISNAPRVSRCAFAYARPIGL